MKFFGILYVEAFIGAAVLSAFFTLIVIRIAKRFNIVDVPTSDRKIHDRPIPLLGGVALFLSFFAVSGYFLFATDLIGKGYVLPKHVVGIFLAALFIIILGIIDDKYPLSPAKRFWLLFIPVVIVIASGVGVASISNPFGDYIELNEISVTVFHFQGIPYRFTLLADLFTVAWLMGMMFTTKLLDGLDGLVSGIGVIGAFVIFLVSLRPDLLQYDTALLAIIFAGAATGFLIFNFNPAKIFLGESGSVFVGFMLGTLSIIAGSKIATALLIMGIPILDVVWVIIRRLTTGRKLTQPDRKHLHHRFLDAGFTKRQTVLIFYGVTILFGLSAVILQTRYKTFALLALVIVTMLMGYWLVMRYNRFKLKNKG